jgi:hypothetical protein
MEDGTGTVPEGQAGTAAGPAGVAAACAASVAATGDAIACTGCWAPWPSAVAARAADIAQCTSAFAALAQGTNAFATIDAGDGFAVLCAAGDCALASCGARAAIGFIGRAIFGIVVGACGATAHIDMGKNGCNAWRSA